MSMTTSTPEKCPKCGSRIQINLDDFKAFECGVVVDREGASTTRICELIVELTALKAELETVKAERDGARKSLSEAGAHLKDYHQGGTPQDVVEACEEFAELSNEIDEKHLEEFEGADSILDCWNWLMSSRDTLRARLDEAENTIRKVFPYLWHSFSCATSIPFLNLKCTCGAMELHTVARTFLAQKGEAK